MVTRRPCFKLAATASTREIWLGTIAKFTCFGIMKMCQQEQDEYLSPSSCDDKFKLGGEEIKNVTTFKYLGSIVDTEGGTTTYWREKTEFDLPGTNIAK